MCIIHWISGTHIAFLPIQPDSVPYSVCPRYGAAAPFTVPLLGMSMGRKKDAWYGRLARERPSQSVESGRVGR
jgi:hypothetical protein